MGDKQVTSEYDETQMRAFTKGALNDLQALEMMIGDGLIEEDVRRIGAEQEMFLVDSSAPSGSHRKRGDERGPRRAPDHGDRPFQP